MVAPRMPNVYFSGTYIARLLADKLTPDFNFKEQLWFVARANAQEAAQYLCLLLRTQFDFQPKDDGESFFHDCLTDGRHEVHRPFSVVVSRSHAKDIAQRALVLRDARQRFQNDPSPFPFLQLPFEIRLQVYDFIFMKNRTLETRWCQKYIVTPGGDGCRWEGAYELHARSGIFGTEMNTALLLTSQQIFNEAEPILYQTRFLNIGPSLNEGLEFLRSLSPRARRNIRGVHIALPHTHLLEFEVDDSLEAWCKLCVYMSQNLRLRALTFNAFVEAVPANFVDVPWVENLVKIRGLGHLMQRELEGDGFMGIGYTYQRAPNSDQFSYKGLNPRLQALQSYLKSEMCQYSASRLSTEKEEVWCWKSYFYGHWAANEEPET